MKVIFLDIDGVLNCIGTKARCEEYTGIDTAKVKLVSSIVEQTGAVVVLTSTWKQFWNKRNHFDKYMHNKFSKGHLEIYSCTDPDQKSWQRGNNIHKWIKEHDVESYVILDDEVFMDYDIDILQRLVKTEYEDKDGGLHEKDVQLAVNILNDGFLQEVEEEYYDEFEHKGLR